MARYAVVAVLVALLSSTARAEEGIAFEVFTGQRSADASRLLEPILEELALTQKTASGDGAKRVLDRVSIPASDDNGLPSNFDSLVDDGFKAFLAGSFDASATQLGDLVAAAHRNPGAIAKDQSKLEPLGKALIGLALAQSRRGDLAAMNETFKELVRAFPQVKIDKNIYGPDAATAFAAAQKDVNALGKGKLTVKLKDPNGVVFIDERYRSAGNTSVDVPAGDYRVLVLANGAPSRVHTVTVKGGAESTIEIDARFDQAMHTGSSWTGFLFANAQEREQHEAQYAAQAAKQIGARSVAIVGIDQQKGRNVIVGSLISLESGHEIRRAVVAMEPDPSTSQLKGLAKFLSGSEAPPGVEAVAVSNQQIIEKSDHVPDGTPHSNGSGMMTVDRRWGGWRWIGLTATVGLTVSGGTLLYYDNKCKGVVPTGHPCNEVYKNEPAAEILLLSAVPVAALTIYLMVTQTQQVPSNYAWVAPVDNGAVAGYTMHW